MIESYDTYLDYNNSTVILLPSVLSSPLIVSMSSPYYSSWIPAVTYSSHGTRYERMNKETEASANDVLLH